MISEMILGAGCFCDVEPSFACLNGVLKTKPGYSSDKAHTPAHKIEIIHMTYDTEDITFSELLDIFFMIHDPTTVNRQGHHKGYRYTSSLFYGNADEKAEIMSKIKQVSPYFSNPIMTLVFDKKQCRLMYPHRLGCCQKTKSKIAAVNQEKFLQRKLKTDQYWVMRGKGTEPPFSGQYIYTDTPGVYTCAACGQKLFLSDHKFQSGCGWPAFDSALPKSVVIRKDFSHFMIRDEALCSRCCSHLGHVFNDGPTKTGLRYCINSLALYFIPADTDIKSK